MHGSEARMIRLRPQPLSADAFARFGEVLPSAGVAGPQPVPAAFERTAQAVQPYLSILRLHQAATLPLSIARLERHPFSAQTFLPLLGGSCLVVVCEKEADGSPALATMRAFIARPGQGVTYHRDVWHHSVTALEAPCTLAIVMAQTGHDNDTVLFDFDNAIDIVVTGT